MIDFCLDLQQSLDLQKLNVKTVFSSSSSFDFILKQHTVLIYLSVVTDIQLRNFFLRLL